MQYLSRDALLQLVGMTSGTFDQLQRAGFIALAFGSPFPATPGRYLDLDCVAMAVNAGLGQSLPREVSTTIVLGFFNQWGSAVGHAEADKTQDYFTAVGGVGWDDTKKGPKLLLVTNGTADQIAQDFRKGVVGYYAVNISDIIRRLRERGRTIGIDLSSPFFFAPGDPRFNEILTMVKQECDLRIARLRKDKKKLAKMKARGRRQSQGIAAAERVKNERYAFGIQEIT
jgi:hypothetical protein